MNTVTIQCASVIDAVFAADGLRGVLAERTAILGRELEAALRRLFPHACAELAVSVDGLTLESTDGWTAVFRLAAAVPAVCVESALVRILLGMARAGETEAATRAVRILADAIADAEAAACPATRVIHDL